MNDRGPYHQTRSGRIWFPYDPRPEDVHREDLLALGNVCRFGGHVMPGCWYSNLEHSYRVAVLLESGAAPSAVVLQGLAHDLHEVFPPHDQLSPVIRGDMEYARFARELSRKASRAVRASLGLPEHLDPVVKRADSTEVRIDFSKVEYVANAAISALLSVNKKAIASDTELILCNVSPQVFEQFSSRRFDKVFRIERAIATN